MLKIEPTSIRSFEWERTHHRQWHIAIHNAAAHTESQDLPSDLVSQNAPVPSVAYDSSQLRDQRTFLRDCLIEAAR